MNDSLYTIYTQIDLHDAIYNYGLIVDELEQLLNFSIENNPTQDETSTVLCGLLQTCKWKYDILFQIFENLIKRRIIDDDNKINDSFHADRFDLEHAIANFGMVIDELENLIEVTVEGEPTNDELSNALNGFQQLSKWKFEKVIRLFNGLIENGIIKKE